MYFSISSLKLLYYSFVIAQSKLYLRFFMVRPVVPGGAMAPPVFGRSVYPISIKGGRLCPPKNTGTPGFSDFPTALYFTVLHELTVFIIL